MALYDLQFKSFTAFATGTLRLDPDAAASFARHVATGAEGLPVIAQLCTGPNALPSPTLATMLERFFCRLPDFSAASEILGRKPGPLQAAPPVDQATALLLHARVFEICLSQRGLSEAEALKIADLIGEAASAFFALEQKCRAPDRHTQKLLGATLRTALGQALDLARQAAAIFLSAPPR